MKICFLLGSPSISGGTYVIFQHALYGMRIGHDVTVVPMFPVDEGKDHWHPALAQLKFKTLGEVKDIEFDVAVATWWKTMLDMPKIKAKSYTYFVQSIESWFAPESEIPLRKLIDKTYEIDMPVITEAKWIRDYLINKYNRDVWLAPNGIRKDFLNTSIKPIENRLVSGLRVLVEGPLGSDIKNVARTINLVRSSRPKEVWLLTSTPLNKYPGVDRVFSHVPADKIAEIYSSCDVLVKLSYVEGMFGPPLEMFHCGGTAIVYDVTGYDEYIVNNQNSIVVKTDDERGVIESIKLLKSDLNLLNRLKNGALKTASEWPSWDMASKTFFDCLDEIYSQGAKKVFNMEKLDKYISDILSEYIKNEQARVNGNLKLKLSIKFNSWLARSKYYIHYLLLRSVLFDSHRTGAGRREKDLNF